MELNINRINNNTLNISWPLLSINQSNGVILSYSLFRDNELIYLDKFSDNGYFEDLLDTYYIDTNLTVDQEYNYQIEYKNSKGSILGNNYTFFLEDWVPKNITNLQLLDVNYNNVSIKWSCENETEYKYSLLDNVNRLNIDYEYNNKSCLGIIPNL